MQATPASGKHSCAIPLRVTQSEARILNELLSIATLRAAGSREKWIDSDYLKSVGIESAEACIGAMRAELFPLETALRKNRTTALRALNGGSLRTHFDNTLETASLTIHAQIKSKADFDNLVTRLQSFEFSEWQRLCDGERIDAD